MEKKFEPHMMYKGCEGIMAKTMKKHLSLKKKGYDHKKSKQLQKRNLKHGLVLMLLVGV